MSAGISANPNWSSPKLRIGALRDDIVELKPGERLRLLCGSTELGDETQMSVSWTGLAEAVDPAPVPLGANLAMPRPGMPARPAAQPPRPVAFEAGNGLDFLKLQGEIAKQRTKPGRIRLPDEPGAIHWGSVCRTYQPDLAAAWAACRQRFGAEANQDAVFEASVFWVVSGARESFY